MVGEDHHAKSKIFSLNIYKIINMRFDIMLEYGGKQQPHYIGEKGRTVLPVFMLPSPMYCLLFTIFFQGVILYILFHMPVFIFVMGSSFGAFVKDFDLV